MAYGVLPDFSGAAYIGVSAPADPAAHVLTQYAKTSMYWIVWRPWIWVFAAVGVAISALVVRMKDGVAGVAACASALCMMSPFMIFGQGLSCRYYVPIFMMFVVCFAILGPGLVREVVARLWRRRASVAG